MNLRNGEDQRTFLAVARNDRFAILAPFENCLDRIQPEFSLLLFFAVTAKARGFKDGPNVFGVGDPLFSGNRRQLARVEFADVPLVVVGAERPTGH